MQLNILGQSRKYSKEESLILALLPRLFHKRWGKLNLNELAADLVPLLGIKGNNPFLDPDYCERWKNFLHKVKEIDYSWGGYMEDRADVWRGHYQDPGATIHVAVDYYVPTDEPVYMPVDGKLVDYYNDNDDNGGWGGRLIFQYAGGYVLFGHLKDMVADVDNNYKAGSIIGYIAEPAVNGGWSPHLHVQCMKNLDVSIDGYLKYYQDIEADFPDPVEYLTNFSLYNQAF